MGQVYHPAKGWTGDKSYHPTVAAEVPWGRLATEWRVSPILADMKEPLR